jgi:AcrR family transcriptional regulator
MRRSSELTKMKIAQAAIHLFDSQGFDGTTVRQIAKQADVNVALISYYFKNKQGLMEYIMVHYYEELFRRLAKCKEQIQMESRFSLLTLMLKELIRYQAESHKVTRFIHRELSLESMLGREIMCIYIQQIKHDLSSVIEEGIMAGEFPSIHVDGIVMNLLSMIYFPYAYPQILREVFYMEPVTERFVEQIIGDIMDFLKKILQPIDVNQGEEK